MGTKTFPDENEWETFLSDHGGFSNAFTEAEHTVFHFVVDNEYFGPSMKVCLLGCCLAGLWPEVDLRV